MDSIHLFKGDKKSIKKNKKHTIKIKDILLFSILFSNLFIIYLIYNLKIEHNKVKSESLNLLKNNNVISRNKDNSRINNIIEQSFFEQINFCNNPYSYLNQEYENIIKLTDYSFKNISYQMYIYKEKDNFMSNSIMRTKKYEPKVMSNFYDILQYYKIKKNILNNKDLYILDVGANIGAYPSFLGKLGYSIISFEASPRNYYILRKNYCHINKNANNIILINKGISNQEKICNYYIQLRGIGNGILLCDEDKEYVDVDGFQWKKTYQVDIMKLDNIIPYISDKNLVLLKLDIEGSEGLAIQGGIELVTKYHIPYIFSEFSTEMLEKHGTNPREYIEIFTKNGYKISKEGFLSDTFISIDEVTTRNNYYFIYKGNQ